MRQRAASTREVTPTRSRTLPPAAAPIPILSASLPATTRQQPRARDAVISFRDPSSEHRRRCTRPTSSAAAASRRRARAARAAGAAPGSTSRCCRLLLMRPAQSQSCVGAARTPPPSSASPASSSAKVLCPVAQPSAAACAPRWHTKLGWMVPPRFTQKAGILASSFSAAWSRCFPTEPSTSSRQRGQEPSSRARSARVTSGASCSSLRVGSLYLVRAARGSCRRARACWPVAGGISTDAMRTSGGSA